MTMPRLDDAAGVRTYYEELGSGAPLVLLHGGLESGSGWQSYAEALSAHRRVLVPDRRGHGRTPDTDGAYTYEAMADETVAFLEQVAHGPADLIGYSDGGVVALLVASSRPELVRSLVVIGTNFNGDGLLPTMAERLSHPDPDNPGLGPLRDVYAKESPDGPTHWPTFHAKVSEMGVTGPAMTVDDLERIEQPVLIVVGDDDVVDHHHTVDMFEHLPMAQLAVVPGASHLLPIEQPDELLRMITRFLDGGPPKRMMPMRTARA
jgi:pimeloyl-ACP methyl ester carboxylesterase